MKKTLAIAAILSALAVGAHASNYTITINGKTVDIDLDKELKIETSGGEFLTIVLKQKDFFEFTSDFFSMVHRKTLNPVKTDLGEGVSQTMLMSAKGTGVLIQEYQNVSPQSLVDLMINELTKEEVEYGYKKTEEKVEKKIDGKVLSGKRAETAYGEDHWVREVYVLGGKDCGVLVVTVIEKNSSGEEQFIIDEFWEKLKITL